jgi:hypothetical protein
MCFVNLRAAARSRFQTRPGDCLSDEAAGLRRGAPARDPRVNEFQNWRFFVFLFCGRHTVPDFQTSFKVIDPVLWILSGA